MNEIMNAGSGVGCGDTVVYMRRADGLGARPIGGASGTRSHYGIPGQVEDTGAVVRRFCTMHSRAARNCQTVS